MGPFPTPRFCCLPCLPGLAWGGSVCMLEVFWYYGCRVSVCSASLLFCKSCMWAKGKCGELTFSGSETCWNAKEIKSFFWRTFKKGIVKNYFSFKKIKLQSSAQGSKLLPEHSFALYSKLKILICWVDGISFEILNFDWCFQQMYEITHFTCSFIPAGLLSYMRILKCGLFKKASVNLRKERIFLVTCSGAYVLHPVG